MAWIQGTVPRREVARICFPLAPVPLGEGVYNQELINDVSNKLSVYIIILVIIGL